MSLSLAVYSQPYLHNLVLCARCFDEDLIDRFRDENYKGDAQFGNEHWIRVIATTNEHDDDDVYVHFHVDFVRSFGVGKKNATYEISEIEALIDAFVDKEVVIRAWAGFQIPLEEVPKNAFVSAFHDISFEVEEDQFSLTGASFESDGKPIPKLEWSIDDEKVRVELTAQKEKTVVGSDYFTQRSEVFADFFEKLVTSSKSRAHHDDPSAR